MRETKIKNCGIFKEHFMNMPESALHKAFRKKDIKVNGKRVVKIILYPGDIINVYILIMFCMENL